METGGRDTKAVLELSHKLAENQGIDFQSMVVLHQSWGLHWPHTASHTKRWLASECDVTQHGVD